MSTVFSSNSPTSQDAESQELTTLAAFIAHIERLQDQVRYKDTYIADLERDFSKIRDEHSQLQHDHHETTLQLDIQNELLSETRHMDAHVTQLRAAIIDREAVIGEKEKSIHAIERQLEHHKLLLQAEVRRHAAIKLHMPNYEDPLPDLTSLATKGDIDKWIDRLHQRLSKEHQMNDRGKPGDVKDTQMENLRREIDFYIREIIYYKLDIKGYKSDIKKLKRITAQLSSHGDIESDTSSLRPASTPNRPRFASATPELGASGTTSPIVEETPIKSAVDRPITPQPLDPNRIPGFSPIVRARTANKPIPLRLDLKASTIPQTPAVRAGHNLANETDDIDPGVSPRSNVRLSPERRKPTVCAPALL